MSNSSTPHTVGPCAIQNLTFRGNMGSHALKSTHPTTDTKNLQNPKQQLAFRETLRFTRPCDYLSRLID